MKKFLLAFFAVILAVGMSAFTVNQPQQTRYYFDNGWHETLETCPVGQIRDCVKLIDGMSRQIYTQPDFDFKLKYN